LNHSLPIGDFFPFEELDSHGPETVLFIYFSEAFVKQHLPVGTMKDEWLVISK